MPQGFLQFPMDQLQKEMTGVKLDLCSLKLYLDESFKGLQSHIKNIDNRIEVNKPIPNFTDGAEMRLLMEALVELDETPTPVIRYKDALPITPRLMKETVKAKRKVEFARNIDDYSFDRYVDYFPKVLQPFILEIEDPKGDGNCGFRALALALGYGEDGWVQVQVDLLVELHANKEEYTQMFGNEGITNCEEKLQHFMGDAPEGKWMLLPEHGYLAASKYSVAIVYFAMAGCLSFLPLRSAFIENDHKVIGIGGVPNHFLKLNLEANCPMPEIAVFWEKHHHEIADGWKTYFMFRFDAFPVVFRRDNFGERLILIDSN